MATIKKIRDNIITIEGNDKFRMYQYFDLGNDIKGFVLSAFKNTAILLSIGDPSSVVVGTKAKPIPDNTVVEFKQKYFGKIISPFGDIVHARENDTNSSDKVIGSSDIFQNSPGIINRIKLSEPVDTGMLAIDTMIPIGKGQRELIIGDRTTGKTYIALNTIINQKKKMKSVYIAVGQKQTSIINAFNILEENDALDDCVIVYANSDSPAQQFLAPMIGLALAEALAYKGEDVLVVVDDLTKHANIYREISLSIDRTPGREAYPNDIFFLHSRLLERGGKFDETFNNGSISIIPIVETVEDDIASLIPSNIISITDGQIFTSSELFNKGSYPAINIQKSVSRTGSAVQSNIVKMSSRGLKADHARFEEIKKFTSMSVDISDDLSVMIDKSKQLDKIILQYGNIGYTREEIAIIVGLYKNNMLVPGTDIRTIQYAISGFMQKTDIGKQLKKIVSNKNINPNILNKFINIALEPIVDGTQNSFGKFYTRQEYEELKGGK